MKDLHKYFHITTLEQKWGFYVNTVGYSITRPNASYPANTHHPMSHILNWNQGRILTDYYLVFISKGKGIFESAITSSSEISEGTCFLLYPGVWHRYRPNMELGWEEYWIGFNGSYPKELMNNGFFTPEYPIIQVGLSYDLLTLFQSMIETIPITTVGYHQIRAAIALQILGVVNAHSINQKLENDPIERSINKAKLILQDCLNEPTQMPSLATDLNMGYSAFRKVFKQRVGVSPNQYQLNIKLSKAKHLLSSTDLSISEVAYQTGFESLYYFSRLFKRKTGLPPKKFRIKNA